VNTCIVDEDLDWTGREKAVRSGTDLHTILQVERDGRCAAASLHEFIDYCLRPVYSTVGVHDYFNSCRGEGSANGPSDFTAAACYQCAPS